MSDGDAGLLAALRAGDEEAFATLVARYHPRLLRFAESLVPSRAVAEEVVQDTWLGVVRGIDRFEGRSSVKTWLLRILTNRARSAGAREHRSDPLGADVLDGRFDGTGAWIDPPLPWADAVEDRIVAASMAKRIRGCLAQLPEGQRQVFTLRDIEGIDPAQVCDLLEVSAGNQRVLLHRARAHIRGLISADVGKTDRVVAPPPSAGVPSGRRVDDGLPRRCPVATGTAGASRPISPTARTAVST